MPSKRQRRAFELQESTGFTGLKAVPDWKPLAFAEEQHHLWSEAIINLLAAHEAGWRSADQGRPGDEAAAHANDALRSLGAKVWVSTTHPSTPDTWESNDDGGPRWYVSVIEAAWQQGGGCCDNEGKLPHLPPRLVDILWPESTDGESPWVTELGWTVVPPHSAPQVWHADIVRCASEPPGWTRAQGRGRFHHVAFKPGRQIPCTTEGVRGSFSFSEGDEPIPWLWAEERAERMTTLPCTIFDSEMVHRGAASGAGWGTTVTAQLCSSSGWPALSHGGRCSPSLLQYTIPIHPSARASLHKSPQSSKRPRSPKLAVEEAVKTRVEVAPQELHARLHREGWAELEGGLPADWAAWPVIQLVEELHATYAPLVECELASAMRQQVVLRNTPLVEASASHVRTVVAT